MATQYLSVRENLSSADFSFSVAPGGTTTVATTLNFYLVARNRAGINRVNIVTPLTVGVGEKLVVNLGAGLRGEGEDIYQLIVAAEDTGNAIDAVILAAYNTKEADQVTDRPIPAVLELITDDQLAINATVADLNSFPSNPANGNIREVTSESAFYQYSADLNQWEPIATNSAYVTGTTELGGSDRPLSLVENPIIPPDTSTNTFSTPIKIAFFNGLLEDGGASLQAGSQFNLLLSVNGQQQINGIEYNNLFAGFVRVTFLGYVRRLSGTLDINFATVGEPLIWFPNKGVIFLPANLPRGYGAAWEISINVDSDRVNGLIPNNSIVSFNLYDQGLIGTPSDIGRITGDVIFNEGDRLRIVPNKRLGGVAVIGGGAQQFYLTPTLAQSNLFGILTDSADQQIAISGLLGGTVIVRPSGATLQPLEALRAIISTETGIYKASNYSDIITVAANQSIRATVALPVDTELEGTIRPDYPDIIAGTPNVVFNPPALIPYVEFEGIIYQLPQVIIVPAATIDFSIDSLTNGTVVSNLPTSAADFGLFDYGSLSGVADPSGSLAAGDYRVAIAWSYSSPNVAITKITHSTALGCIPEFNQTLAELLTLNRSFAIDANSVADLQDIPADVLATNPVVILNRSDTEKELYAYFPNFAGTIDNDLAIAVNNGAGAMVRVSSASGSSSATAFDPDTILTSPSGEVLISSLGFVLVSEVPPTNTSSTSIVLIEAIPLTSLLFSPSGELLFSPTGEILLESENSIVQIDENSSGIIDLNSLLLSSSGDILVNPEGVPLLDPQINSTENLVLRKSDLDSLLLSPSGKPLVSPSGEFLTQN